MRTLARPIALTALCLVVARPSAADQDPSPTRFNDMFGAWSPNGRMIAFASDRTGDAEIYVANADGTGLRRLTRSPGRDAHPSWSRDGRRLLFQSPREGGDVRIFTMRSDGSGQRRLAATRGFCGVPFESPVGADIVFQCSRSTTDFGAKDHPWRIFRLRNGQPTPRAITFGPGNDQVPTWSRDGRRIVFFSDRSGVDQLYVLDLATRRHRQLTFGPARHNSASFAPDGKRIAMMRAEPNGKADVFVLGLPDRLVRITRTGPQFGTPMFSPDGRTLLFQMPTPAGSRLFLAPADGSAEPRPIEFRP